MSLVYTVAVVVVTVAWRLIVGKLDWQQGSVDTLAVHSYYAPLQLVYMESCPAWHFAKRKQNF